jgi:hypothetical protein
MRAYVAQTAIAAGAHPDAWGNQALREVRAHASSGTTQYGGLFTQALASSAVKAFVASQGARAAYRERKTFQEVRPYTSIGQPMGLQRDLEALGYPHVLCSFVFDRDGKFFTEKIGYDPPSWMGDSGAFSVRTRGEEVDVDEYAAWAVAYTKVKPDFATVSLDVIPEPGSTKKQRQRAMKQGLENGDRLRAAGLRIMEVYHYGEPIDYLETLLSRRRPGEIVAFGGMASGRERGTQREFCDAAFAYLRDNFGWGNLPRIHNLGCAPTSKMAPRYPWFSMDSSSWMASARYGTSVGRGGLMTGADTRNSVPVMRSVYLVRVLERWNRLEQNYTEMWEARGVRFAE